MYLIEMSQWVLSQWIFSMQLLSEWLSPQWESVIFGSLPWIIGALIGGFCAFSGPYYLWRQQQTKELKTLANAFIIDLERVYNSNFATYFNYKEKNDIKCGNGYITQDKPFYDGNGTYFLFAHDIYKFDYELSSKILTFYDDLLSAESSRKFIKTHIKIKDYIYVDCYYFMMKAQIISTQEKILNLRKQLKKVRGE